MKTVRMLYLILVNTLILLVLAVLGADFLIKTYYYFRDAPSGTYRMLPDVAKRNYDHMTSQDVDELLRTTGNMRFRYVPWVGYKEEVTKSRFVNVDANGIRANEATPRDISSIEGAIWFFGGSTTFGDGVADAETIPARLEKLIGRPVVNFGAGGYYSAQENLLLNQYLRIGYRPSMTLFLDGINERCDMEVYQDEMKLLFAKAQIRYEWDILEVAKPVILAYDKANRKLKALIGVKVNGPEKSELICEDTGKRNALRMIHERILAERASLCRLYEFECTTFVQPFAGVHGQHDDARFSEADRKGMRGLFNHLESSWRNAGAIFVTDALDQHKRHAYIDDKHYSAAASELIARAIAVHLTRRESKASAGQP